MVYVPKEVSDFLDRVVNVNTEPRFHEVESISINVEVFIKIVIETTSHTGIDEPLKSSNLCQVINV